MEGWSCFLPLKTPVCLTEISTESEGTSLADSSHGAHVRSSWLVEYYQRTFYTYEKCPNFPFTKADVNRLLIHSILSSHT